MFQAIQSVDPMPVISTQFAIREYLTAICSAAPLAVRIQVAAGALNLSTAFVHERNVVAATIVRTLATPSENGNRID
jgi:hypothetical protein